VSVAGTISAQWEKFTGWLVTGLAATLALIVSNLDKAKDMLQPSSVSFATQDLHRDSHRAHPAASPYGRSRQRSCRRRGHGE
jgi:hypothetical protein